MAKSTKRGFTALELSVVVTMMAIMVAFVLPSLVNQQASERDRAFKIALGRLAGQARQGAITDNRTYHLQMDGDQKVVLKKEDENGNTSTGDPIASIDIPAGNTANQYVMSGATTNQGDFDIHFYSDGTSDTGGIEFQRGSNTGSDAYALNIDSRGNGSVDDALTDTTTTTWDAGAYESR